MENEVFSFFVTFISLIVETFLKHCYHDFGASFSNVVVFYLEQVAKEELHDDVNRCCNRSFAFCDKVCLENFRCELY